MWCCSAVKSWMFGCTYHKALWQKPVNSGDICLVIYLNYKWCYGRNHDPQFPKVQRESFLPVMVLPTSMFQTLISIPMGIATSMRWMDLPRMFACCLDLYKLFKWFIPVPLVSHVFQYELHCGGIFCQGIGHRDEGDQMKISCWLQRKHTDMQSFVSCIRPDQEAWVMSAP